MYKRKVEGKLILKISDELASYVTEPFPEETIENKIKRLIENELTRKFAR